MTYKHVVAITHCNMCIVVAHLPPAAFGYRHAGQEFWITEDESVGKLTLLCIRLALYLQGMLQ